MFVVRKVLRSVFIRKTTQNKSRSVQYIHYDDSRSSRKYKNHFHIQATEWSLCSMRNNVTQ